MSVLWIAPKLKEEMYPFPYIYPEEWKHSLYDCDFYLTVIC